MWLAFDFEPQPFMPRYPPVQLSVENIFDEWPFEQYTAVRPSRPSGLAFDLAIKNLLCKWTLLNKFYFKDFLIRGLLEGAREVT